MGSQVTGGSEIQKTMQRKTPFSGDDYFNHFSFEPPGKMFPAYLEVQDA